MSQYKVGLVQTGTANIASVRAALQRLGGEPVPAETPAQILSASHLVLPGVGAFGAAMQNLEQAGLVEALRTRLQKGSPTLVICLGLQLLAETSEESPGVKGLGIVSGSITRFSDELRVPQFGWSSVNATEQCHYLHSGYSYFANSYCMRDIPEGWDVALSDYGGKYVAAMERDGVLACQFHPELSGAWGHGLISRWLEQKRSA